MVEPEEYVYNALRAKVAATGDASSARALQRLASARKDREAFVLAGRALGVFLAEDLTDALEGSARAMARYLETLKTSQNLGRLVWLNPTTGQAHTGQGLLAEVFTALSPESPPRLCLQIHQHAIEVLVPQALILHFLADLVTRLSAGLPSSPSLSFAKQAIEIARAAASNPSSSTRRRARVLVDEVFPLHESDALSYLARSLAETAAADVTAYPWQDIKASLKDTGWARRPFLDRAFDHFIGGLIAALTRLADAPAYASPFERLKHLATSLTRAPLTDTTPIEILRPLHMRPWGTDRLFGPPVGLSSGQWPRESSLGDLYCQMCTDLYHGITEDQLDTLKGAFDGDTRLDHLSTIELDDLRPEGIPPSTAALSVFVGFTAFNLADTPDSPRVCVRHSSDTDLEKQGDEDLPADIASPLDGDGSVALRRRLPFRGLIRHRLDVPTEVFSETLDEESPLHALRTLLSGFSYLGGSPIWRHGPDQDERAFVMQLHEDLFDGAANFGDRGVLYVFTDTAFWQCG